MMSIEPPWHGAIEAGEVGQWLVVDAPEEAALGMLSI
jgi:hypothetical protein